MANIQESADQRSLKAGLVTGIKTLSMDEHITFVLYKRLVLPLDGFVFWVRADLLTPSALFNGFTYDSAAFDQAPQIQCPAKELHVPGSFHFSTERNQSETASESINKVIFTTPVDINELNRIDPTCIYIGHFKHLKFAFNNHALFFEQAGLFHYRGDAIYPTMESQIIDKFSGLDTSALIVSNSLPFWLALNLQNPIFPYPAGGYNVPIYPSGLVPDNIRPPYASVHIDPDQTTAMAMVPHISRNSNHSQLTRDTVRITFYGLNNSLALAFQDYVNWVMLNVDQVGLMNLPIIQDEKKIQSELTILAQKKSITYKVSYHQRAMVDVARQLILSAFVQFNPLDLDSSNFILSTSVNVV